MILNTFIVIQNRCDRNLLVCVRQNPFARGKGKSDIQAEFGLSPHRVKKILNDPHAKKNLGAPPKLEYRNNGVTWQWLPAEREDAKGVQALLSKV